MHAPQFLVAAPGPGDSRGNRFGLLSLPREIAVRLLTRVRAVRPESWWLLLFVCLLFAFGLALVFQPTVGRGGR